MHPHGHGLREEDAAFHADMKLKSRSLYHTKSFSFLHGPTQALHPYYRLIARTYIPRSQSPPNRHIPPPLTPPPDHNRIIIIDAPRPIIRHAAQTPKNIPNIIRRRHPLRKRLIPPVQNPLHHLPPPDKYSESPAQSPPGPHRRDCTSPPRPRTAGRNPTPCA